MEQSIGERIRLMRLQQNMSMQALGDAIGKSKGNISGYEKGTYEPSAQTIVSMAHIFNVSTDWLLTGAESQSQNHSNQQGSTNIRTNISDAEASLLDIFRFLDSRDKEDIMDILYTKYRRASGKEASLYSTYTDENSEELFPPSLNQQGKIG